ncbi:MAG: hypothetical protein V7746_01030, partial [Halioglobus sp.]
MSSIEQHAKSTHGALSEVAQVQLETLNESFTRSSESVASSWQNSDRERLAQWSAAFNEAQTSSVSHLSDTAKLVAQELRDITTAQQASFSTATEDFQTLATALNTGWVETGQNMQEQVSAFSAELNALREEEQQRNVGAGESLAKLEATAASHLSQLEATAANHLSALGKELEQPMTRLIETASETPKAAAEVIGHLRNEITANIERDNQLLQERQQIMEQLNTVAASLTESTSAQHEVVEKMISGSAVVLETAGNRFSEQLDGVTGALTESSSAQHKAVEQLVGSSAQILETAGNRFGEQLNGVTDALTESSSAQHKAVEQLVGSSAQILETAGNRFGEQLNGVTDALTESSSTQNKAVEQLIGSSAKILENAGNRFGEQLSGVADSLTESSTAQQQAVDQLLGGSAKILDTAGTRFSEQLEREGEKFTGIADNVAASSGDMISLSETFALAVELFNQSNSSLIEQLASIEESMTDTTSRSDEQMAYYVAQAREIIDQSLLSQREVFEELRQLKDANPVAAEAS